MLSMHAPFETVSKLDCYETYKGAAHRSSMKVSKAADCMPVTPSEPISSLSARMHTAVFTGVSSRSNIRKDGTKVTVRIGEEEGEPRLVITDLLPHLGAAQNVRMS